MIPVSYTHLDVYKRQETYKQITSNITKFIQGDTKQIINELQEKMYNASEVQNYELAKECRDLISHIQHVTSKQHVQFNDLVDRDIVGYYHDKGYLCLQLFFMRNGKLLARDLNLVPMQDDFQEQIISFLVLFYQENTEPKELLVPKLSLIHISAAFWKFVGKNVGNLPFIKKKVEGFSFVFTVYSLSLIHI